MALGSAWAAPDKLGQAMASQSGASKSALDKVGQAMAMQGASKSALDKVGQAISNAKMNKMALAKEKARCEFLEVTAPMRSKVMGSMKASIKAGILADPDMWQCVKKLGNTILDNLLDDVEKEIERNLHTALLQQQADADAPGPKGSLLSCCWYRLRAFFLYHYLPHDKYFFGKLKDPVFLIMYMATLVPVHGLRILIFAIILLFLVFPGKPDEFQLINFILLCKGMQFLTSGLIQLAAGATKYFACYSVAKGDLLECIDRYGPGAADGFGLAMDYLGSILLVWLAWHLLTRSEKHGQDKHQAETDESIEKAAEAGGRLRSLLIYDMRCFFGSLCLLFALTALTCWQHFQPGGHMLRGLREDPQFAANIFWCCVGYSILSMPFAPFLIPGLQEVMTHCYATGYNRNGACVSFDMPSAETDDGKSGPSYNTYLNFLATNTTKIVHTINRGRALRGARDGDVTEYKFGDFTRGLYAQITGHGNEAAAATMSVFPRPKSPMSSTTGSEWWRGEEIARAIKQQFGTEESAPKDGTSSSPEADPTAPPEKVAEEVLTEEDRLCTHSVSAVELPPDGMVEAEGGIWQFSLTVVPEGSLDAENGAEVWEVMRRYSDFEKLAGKLGNQTYYFADAPFPKKTWGVCNGDKLEQRRHKLQVWINRVLQDPQAQDTWARPLHEFLTVEQYADPEEAKTLIQDITAAGSKMRGNENSYQFGDFTRGLFAKMSGAANKPPGEGCDPEASSSQTPSGSQSSPNAEGGPKEKSVQSVADFCREGGSYKPPSVVVTPPPEPPMPGSPPAVPKPGPL